MRLSSFVTLSLTGLASRSTWNFEVNEEFLAVEKTITEYTAAYPDAINAPMKTLDGGSLTKLLNKFNKLSRSLTMS
jgi:hypothetical protein